MPHPRVRVCIPVAKPLPYVIESIESLRAQSYSDWLAVVLDDRGDQTLERYVLDQLGSKVSYVGPANSGGISANWNRCLDHADSEFIFILHDDDILSPTFLFDAIETLDKNPHVTAVHCRSKPIWESASVVSRIAHSVKVARWHAACRWGRRAVITKGQSGLAELLIGQWMLTPTFVYRAQRIKDFRFDRLEFALDLDFLGRMYLEGLEIAGIPFVNHRLRIHALSQTHRFNSNLARFAEEHLVISRLTTAAKAKGWHFASLCGLVRPLFRLHVLLRLLLGKPSLDRGARKTLFRHLLSR